MKQLSRSGIMLMAWAVILMLQVSQARVLAAEPERISLEQLKDMLDGEVDVIVVDVRSAASYENGHIPGAISIPSNEIAARHEELPRDKSIILY